MKLEYQLICENQRVKMLKDKLLEEFFDLINSWEQNSIESNMKWFEEVKEKLEELNQAIESIDKANRTREKFNLKELTAQRNKLNREISSLKKAQLKN